MLATVSTQLFAVDYAIHNREGVQDNTAVYFDGSTETNVYIHTDAICRVESWAVYNGVRVKCRCDANTSYYRKAVRNSSGYLAGSGLGIVDYDLDPDEYYTKTQQFACIVDRTACSKTFVAPTSCMNSCDNTLTSNYHNRSGFPILKEGARLGKLHENIKIYNCLNIQSND